jgi:hypothetical protein
VKDTEASKRYYLPKILRQPQVWHSAAFCFMSISNLPLQTGHFTQANSFQEEKAA